MKQFSGITIFVFAVVLILTGACKKLPTDTSLLVLNISPYFGTDSLVLGKSYSTANGDSISFNRASFYLSGVVLTGTDGTLLPVPGYILFTPSTGQNIIAGSVPIGTYKSISFNVGIDPTTNHSDPGTYNSGPLAAQTPAMHFTTNATGYIFMAAEGAVDSTNNHLSPNNALSYHIGTDSLLRTVNLPDHSVAPYTAFTATGTKVLTVNIIADFSKLVQNVNISLQPITNTTDNVVIADSLAAHIPGMFRYSN